jgi:hypothetical protein
MLDSSLDPMNRRTFLKLTGLIAAGQALQAAPLVGERDRQLVPPEPERYVGVASGPSGTSLTVQQPGTYRINGLVRLQAPLVEISGIANKQWISWSTGNGSEVPLASFVTFERYDRPGVTPHIRVRGGQLEALNAVAVD